MERINAKKSGVAPTQVAKVATPKLEVQPQVALKSDKIFEMMRVFLERGEGKALVPKVAAVFNFEIKQTKKGKVLKTFTIDLANGQGCVKVGNSKNDACF